MQPSQLRGYHNGMLKNILLTAMLALWLPHAVQAQSDLPDLGEVSDATLSLADEARIGREVMRAMRESGQMLDDVEVSAYLNELGGRLAAFAQLPGGHFSYFAVNDNSINAFAMPGGYIGVHSGLILATQSEGELASVLAHETAHEAQRHIARMQAASNATSPWLLAGTVAAAILASRAGGGQGAMGALSAGMGLSISNQLTYSRDFEREADRVGMQYLAKAGYDVRTMPMFFARLDKANRYSDNAAFAFLRTHPVTTERISEAENRAQDYPVVMRADSLTYLLVREKIRVLGQTPEEASAYYHTALERRLFLNEGAQWYGLARARLAAHDLAGARSDLAEARRRLASHPMLFTLEVAIEREARNWPAARRAVHRGLAAFPQNLALQLADVDVLIDSGARDEALAAVRRQLERRPGDASLYRRQASLYADRDDLRYHAALGNAFYYEQRYGPAQEQYQLAGQAKGNDFYLRSSIEARLREVEKLLKDEKAQSGKIGQ